MVNERIRARPTTRRPIANAPIANAPRAVAPSATAPIDADERARDLDCCNRAGVVDIRFSVTTSVISTRWLSRRGALIRGRFTDIRRAQRFRSLFQAEQHAARHEHLVCRPEWAVDQSLVRIRRRKSLARPGFFRAATEFRQMMSRQARSRAICDRQDSCVFQMSHSRNPVAARPPSPSSRAQNAQCGRARE